MIGPTIMYLIRKTNQTNPERFTEKVKKKKGYYRENGLFKTSDSCSRQDSRYTCCILAK